MAAFFHAARCVTFGGEACKSGFMASHSSPRTVALLLAAGQGTRMKSSLPKVLHPLAGLPMVHHGVAAALDAGCSQVIVVVGHGRELVEAYLTKAFGERVSFALQPQQLGTGDAVRCGVAALPAGTERVLVFYGDAPLIEGTDLRALLGAEGALVLATCCLAAPFGYGRILRDEAGRVVAIREEKDCATAAERAITEINPGVYVFALEFLENSLAKLEPKNAQGELYLTDLVAIAAASGLDATPIAARAEVLVGCNDRAQLFEAELTLRERIHGRLRKSGVTVSAGALVDAGVVVEPDVAIGPNVVLRGNTLVKSGARLDVGCVLDNVTVERDAYLKPYTVAQDSVIGARAQVGPFAHLRPKSDLGADVHIGNFVETKNTKLAQGAKANHLAYLGDGVVGERVNIGAGTIFCNYDGFQKHLTIIEDDAFIGSDSQIVAPVTIGRGAYVGTGTTVTMSVPADGLALSRVKQENKEGYAVRLRARFKAAKEGKK